MNGRFPVLRSADRNAGRAPRVSATAALPCATTFLALSVRRSSGGQHEYVRQLWTRDGDSDKNANRWENGQIGNGCGADWLCASIDRQIGRASGRERGCQTV